MLKQCTYMHLKSLFLHFQKMLIVYGRKSTPPPPLNNPPPALSLFLGTFSVFLNEYFFRWLAQKSSQQIFSVNKLYYAILQSLFCIQLFPRFFKIEVFQQLGFSGSESRVYVHVLEVGQRYGVYFLMWRKKKCENKTKFIQNTSLNYN